MFVILIHTKVSPNKFQHKIIVIAQGVCAQHNRPHRALCCAKLRTVMSFFGVPCNGAAARYNDVADGPVARVTGSGQRYTPRVGGSS